MTGYLIAAASSSSSNAPWWSPLLAGLVGACLAGWFTTRNARKDRREADKRLTRQLDHDRLQREVERRSQTARLERQLAHDRDMRTQENVEAGIRLDRDLENDRLLRDRDHLRQVLGPIAGKLAGASVAMPLISEFHDALQKTDSREKAVRDAQIVVLKQASEFYGDAVTLAILVGEHDPIVQTVADVARKLGSIVDIVSNWAGGNLDDDAARVAVAEADKECGRAEARVLQDAFALAGVRVTRPGAP